MRQTDEMVGLLDRFPLLAELSPVERERVAREVE